MLICENCGKTILESELKTHAETHILETSIGYTFDVEHFEEDCECGGAFVDAEICPVCREYKVKDLCKVCDSCLEEEETVENALLMGDEYKEEVKINSFLASVFTEKEIEEILMREFKVANESFLREYTKEMVKDYLYADKEVFADFVFDKRSKQGRKK